MYEKFPHGHFWGSLACAAVCLCVIPVVLMAMVLQLARIPVAVWRSMPDELPDVSIAGHNYLYDRNGAVFAEVWEQDRVKLQKVNQISTFARQGLIDTEDKRFYDHNGFDFRGTARSALSGHGGGSGLTQQLVKNLQFYDLSTNKNREATAHTYARKARELKLAMNYERHHTKDEILLTYFNTVAFGSPNIYGIETAAQYFFNRHASNLTLAQSAALVGTVQNPVMFDVHGDKWKNRQKVVLDRMVSEGHVSRQQADKAYREKLTFGHKRTSGGNCYTSAYPEYCNYVIHSIKSNPRYGKTRADRERLLARGGLHIHTFLDPHAMSVANDTLKNGYGTHNRIIAPTAVVQPGTGGVLAMAHNRNWGSGSGKTTVPTPLIPAGEGSVYKVFTLAAAMAQGHLNESDLAFSSECPLHPGPHYDAPPGGFKNSVSCGMQGGYMNYKKATAYSSNTWYVTLERRIGVNAVKKFSSSVNLAAPDTVGKRSLSYTLGVVGNSPVNVAAALSTFSNKGVFCPATPVEKVSYGDGTSPTPPDGYNPDNDGCRPVMSPHDAGVVLKAMRANVSGEIPRAFGLKARIPGHDTVGKSGTNQGTNTSWAQLSSGYTVFTNVYDMDIPTRGIDDVYYNGWDHPWYKNTALEAGSTIMKKLLSNSPNMAMDYNNSQETFVKHTPNEDGFILVPSVIGLTPERGVEILSGMGINVKVSKKTVPTPHGYRPGAIAAQSVQPGERLSRGSEKTIVLYRGGK